MGWATLMSLLTFPQPAPKKSAQYSIGTLSSTGIEQTIAIDDTPTKVYELGGLIDLTGQSAGETITITEYERITPAHTLVLNAGGYFNCGPGDIGLVVTDDGAPVGSLTFYDNATFTWKIEGVGPWPVAGGSAMVVVGGAGSGTASAPSTPPPYVKYATRVYGVQSNPLLYVHTRPYRYGIWVTFKQTGGGITDYDYLWFRYQ